MNVSFVISAKQKKCTLAIFAVAIICYYNSLFYPGYLTADSAYILFQTTGKSPLSNWHPIFVTEIWGVLYDIFKSAGGLWSLQIFMYMFVCIQLALNLKTFSLTMIFFLFLCFYPPLITNMAALWKDDWAMIFASASLLSFITCVKKPDRLNLSILALNCVITTMTRVDYFAIIFPFLLFSGMTYTKKDWKFRLKISATVISFTIITSFTVNKIMDLSVEKKLNPWVTIAAWDIAGTENFSSRRVLGYNCQTSDPLVWGDHAMFKINLPEGPLIRTKKEEASEIFNEWKNIVFRHPQAYLKHRMCVAKSFFSYKTDVVYSPYPSPIYINYGLTQKAERSHLNNELYWFYDTHSNTKMYRYWVYILLSSILFFIVTFSLRKKMEWTYPALYLSLILAASRVLVLPAVDFRYGLWILMSTVILSFMIADELFFYVKGKIKNALQK